MKVEQIYTGCLAEAAYYSESKGESVIIDPLRETKPYLERIEEDGSKLKYVLETHFHADFVSGHIDLAKKTGATIVFGPNAEPKYDSYIAKDGEEFKVGDVIIKVLHTPGHTMESTTYLLFDEEGKERGIFTGDTLFIGDVGRPDLAVKTHLTQADLAKHLYKSLREKIMVLPDDVVVYPAHGAGSACGKKMSDETTDTLGNQKKFNYALREDMTEEEFVQEVTEGLVAPPQYFPKNVMMNKEGYDSIDNILDKGQVPRNVEQFEELANMEGALVLDTRDWNEFAKGHIPNSINIGLDGSFAPWVGTLVVDLEQPILFIADEDRIEEVVVRLSRVGYDNTLGFLEGGIEAWKKAGRDLDVLRQVTAEEFAEKFAQGGVNVLDVRRRSEFESEHIEGAENLPLDFLNERMHEVDKSKEYYIHCKSGYRSMTFASTMQARGFNNLIDIQGGMEAIELTNVPRTEFVEPTTML